MLRAGFSKVCISPPKGAPLAGFAAREGVSTGIHDHLYSRALVLSDEQAAFALVSVDLLALPSEFVKRVRTGIENKTGISADAVMIASTHTHAGPVTITTFFNPEESVDADYMNTLAQGIEDSVSRAWEDRFAARVGVGAGRVDGVGVNRRTANQLPIDDQVGIIRVDGLDDVTRAVLINYSCHPTVLGPDNLLVTGDFPSFAVEEIERKLGPNGFAMFVNGTQGNISMGHSSELSAIGVITPGRTFERAAELGHSLAAAALGALPKIATCDSPQLASLSVAVNLPLKDYPPLTEAAKSLKEADEVLTRLIANGAPPESVMPAKTQRLYASITNFYAHETRNLRDGNLPIELQAFRLDDAAFVAIPGEVFVEIGLALKEQSHNPVFVFGIANGYIGYVPTREAYLTGGYEVVSSKCQSSAAEVLIQQVTNITGQLFSNGARGSASPPASLSAGKEAHDR